MFLKLVVDHREALLTHPVVRLGLARGARALQVSERVKAKPATPVGRLIFRLKADDLCERCNRLLISAGEIKRLAERGMTFASERVQHDGAAESRKSGIEVPHKDCKKAAVSQYHRI